MGSICRRLVFSRPIWHAVGQCQSPHWIAGFAARWAGLRATLALSLALFGAATLAALWANEIATLALLRFLAGIGLGATVPVTMSIVDDNVPARVRASLMTFVLCGQPIGALVGAAVCARYIPIYGWQFAFLLGGILPLLLIPAVLVIPVRCVATDGPTGGLAMGTPGRLSELFSGEVLATTRLLWLSVFMASFFIYIIIYWLPASMRSSGSSLQASIVALNLFNFGGIAGALFAAALMDRYGPRIVMPLLFGLAAISMAMLGFSIPFPVLCLAALLSGLAGYAGAMLLGTLAVTLYPASLRTLGVGWMLGVGRFGSALGPLGAGFAIGAGLPIGRLFWFAAAAATFVMCSLLALVRVHPLLRHAEHGCALR